MKAAVIKEFGQPLVIEEVADPIASDNGVVVKVEANGICRSDWHTWMGHTPNVTLPHVPGHELAGTVKSVGRDVKNWKIGDRVTVPFVVACGSCHQCHSGEHQVCNNQFLPGFNAWGSFAEEVAINYADVNLVALPEGMSYAAAASLGCRFTTAFRALVQQGKIAPGEWLAVHGCGGVGLSAIMIGVAAGANVIAVDIDDEKLAFAKQLGAVALINANQVKSVPGAIMGQSGGGAHVSLDALGSPITCRNSIRCLRTHGRHVQVGLMMDSTDAVPMDRVISKELTLLGSQGMAAYKYPELLQMVAQGTLEPEKLVQNTVNLEQGVDILQSFDQFPSLGVTVITEF
ncbi:MAG: zinc-dependent alcohol dehydrogenase family protein [Oceanospirillaceae bacterium]|jgi:alcohol dehydrogenase|nr:zinc-dependent alcohol dehydrogenase family protein [Oceanospirillaceae bacterium]